MTVLRMCVYVYMVVTRTGTQVSQLAYLELCRQLAYHYAGDNAKFDVIHLAYALLVSAQILCLHLSP
jgi:hypothetical protein